MQMLDSTILNTSLPSIAKDLNESPLNMQNAIISYVLTLALFMPVSGFWQINSGRKSIYYFFNSIQFRFSFVFTFPKLNFLVIARGSYKELEEV